MKRFVLIALLVACGKKSPAETSEAVATPSVERPGAPPPIAKIDTAEVTVPPGKSDLHVAWDVPSGTDINEDAPISVRWSSSDGLVSPPSDIKGHGKDVKDGFDVPIDVLPGSVAATLGGEIDLVVCDVATHSVCVPIKRKLTLTFSVGKGGPRGRVTLPLPKAKP